MARDDASFSVRVLKPGAADQPHVDAALAIFTRNTSPLLRTRTNQIRDKLRRPRTPEGTFYFVALYRGTTVIGFAMFGHYPRTRLIVIDHLVIEASQRGDAAFYVFTHLLRDLAENLDLEVDFALIEVEPHAEFGGDQTGGEDLIRLLGQVGFGEVHASYVLPNTEPKNYEKRYQGTLMIRGPQKLLSIRREDLLDLYRSLLYEHYLPWYRDFFGSETAGYKDYLDTLFAEFQSNLLEQPVIRINGTNADQLIAQPLPERGRSPEVRALIFIALFAMCSMSLAAVFYFLKAPPNLFIPWSIAFLVVFAGIVAIANGRAFDVFERGLLSLPFGKHRSSYQQPGKRLGSVGKKGQRARALPRDSAA